MRKSLVLLVILAASLAVAGCGSKKPKPDAECRREHQPEWRGRCRRRWPQASEEGAEAPGPLEGVLAKRTVYFDFDSSEVRGEGTDIVAAHAQVPRLERRHEGAPRRSHRRARLA